MIEKTAAVEKLIQARQWGFTLCKAAAFAGVHVATVCRWQARDPELHRSLHEAKDRAQRNSQQFQEPRPRVRWRRDCPLCKARVVVRTGPGKARFWRCGRWPLCSWAS